MHIGIYGGSFNPIHFGHIGLARWVAEHTDLDEVWMMVSPNNPLKPASMLADEQTRLKQVRDALAAEQSAGTKRIVACDFEFALPRPSYTANTLRELIRAYPEHDFTLIIGEDNAAIFDHWREWEWIVEHIRIFVYPRHGVATRATLYPNMIRMEDAPYFDISSTEIRQRGYNKRKFAFF